MPIANKLRTIINGHMLNDRKIYGNDLGGVGECTQTQIKTRGRVKFLGKRAAVQDRKRT